MARVRVRVMAVRDTFCDLARYYDHIMDHVDYDRWFTVTTALAQLLPRDFVHLDAACGTGTLLKRLRRTGWRTIGVDLSPAMLRAGLSARRPPPGMAPPAAAADLRALPFQSRIDYVTCLFDSVNFLLDMDDVRRMFAEVHGILKDTGLFYFDIVTERMVTQHFDNQEWTEQDGRFSTTWRSSYDRQTHVTETEVRVGTGMTPRRGAPPRSARRASTSSPRGTRRDPCENASAPSGPNCAGAWLDTGPSSSQRTMPPFSA